MTRVLVAWEDTYYEGLARLVRRRLVALAPDPAVDPPHVDFHTSRGNSKFERYVASSWTGARRVGVPGAPGAIDHLVCVIDADKLNDFMPTLPAQPQDPARIGAWHLEAQKAWQAKVCGWVDASVPATTVHGIVLRWSRESALLAGFDREPFREFMGFDIDHSSVRDFLQKECAPSPLALDEPRMFSDTFTKPYGCLKRAFEKQGLTLPSKNDTSFEDVLRALAKGHVETVCSRVPDLDALVRLLWTLATPPVSTSATPVLDETPTRAPANKKRRRSK